LITAVDVRVAFPDWVESHYKHELDTPEMKQPCLEQAKKARDAVTTLFQQAASIRVSFVGYDKYHRWVCIVTVDGVDLATWITDNDLTKAVLCPGS